MKCLLVMGLALIPFVAAAQDPCLDFYRDQIEGEPVDSGSVYALLNTQRGRGCILGATDTTGIEDLYQQLFLTTLEPAEIATARGLLIDELVDHFRNTPINRCDGLAIDCVAGRHAAALQNLALKVAAGDFSDIAATQGEWVPKELDGEIAISSVTLADFLQTHCAGSVDSPDCLEAVGVAAKSMRTGLAAAQLITAHALPVIGVNEQFLSGRDREWQAYLNEAPVQYPWELAVNSWRFQRGTEDPERFPRAPSDQWVVLHPSPAAELIDVPGGGNSTAATIVLEVLGYQRWRWHEGQRRNRWGVSAVVSLADIGGMDHVGYGAMLHTPIPHASLGVIWRDGDDGGETGIILSLDLAKLIQQYRNHDLGFFLSR